MQNKSTLLQQAMDSLKTDPSAENRQAIFSANQQAISDIAKVTSDTVEILQIKPNINGEAESQPAQPLKYSASFEIDLSKILLPSQCGTGSLCEAIKRSCYQNGIKINEEVTTAPCVSVITALAGQHAETDTDCNDVCKAEFVPVFKPTKPDTRALILCYSINGETKLRLDNLKVSTGMTCLGRQSNSTTALQAIEIPNLIALDMQEEQPELFKQLQNSACIVVVAEYDLVQPQNNYSSLSMRGGTMRGGNSQGISAYSVIGQGSQTIDQSTTIHENGDRILKNIHMYVIGALVVNTKKQKLNDAQCTNIANLMQARANELNQLYLAHENKNYTYRGFIKKMNSHMEQYSVNTNTDIIERSLLSLGGIEAEPEVCYIASKENAPQSFFVEYGLPVDTVKQLVTNLQNIFGKDVCQYTPEHNQQQGLETVRFSLELVAKKSALLKQKIDEILQDPRNLMAYQRYAQKKQSLYNDFLPVINAIVSAADLNLYRSNCVELIFIKIFGCKEDCSKARSQEGTSYIGKMLDIHFLLDITEAAANKIVSDINQRFPNTPNHARLVRCDAHISHNDPIPVREIAVSSSLLMSPEFLAIFKTTMNTLIEEQPLLMEQLRIQSGKQSKPSTYYSKELENLVSSYASGKSGPHLMLSKALKLFSDAISNPTGTKSGRLKASENLRRTIALFESTLTASENKAFKENHKKIIKNAQKSLGLYNAAVDDLGDTGKLIDGIIFSIFNTKQSQGTEGHEKSSGLNII